MTVASGDITDGRALQLLRHMLVYRNSAVDEGELTHAARDFDVRSVNESNLQSESGSYSIRLLIAGRAAEHLHSWLLQSIEAAPSGRSLSEHQPPQMGANSGSAMRKKREGYAQARFPWHTIGAVAVSAWLIGLTVASVMELRLGPALAATLTIAGIGLGASTIGFIVSAERVARASHDSESREF